MPDRSRIIKHSALGLVEFSSFDEPRAGGARIPERDVLVVGREDDQQDDGQEKGLRRRVIRANQTNASVKPAEFRSLDRERISHPRGADTHRAESAPKPQEKTREELRAEWDAAWQERMDRAVNVAREEAYALGYSEAQTYLQADFETQKSALARHIQQLRGAWDDLLTENQVLVAELSFDIAQAVLDSPLSPNIKGVVTRALTEAVEQLAGSSPIEIALHPVDFLRLQESGIVEQLESLHAGIRWEPRPEMKHGDWVVQSPVAAIRRLEDELMGTLKSRLGLLALVQKRSGTPDGADSSSHSER